MLPYPHVHVGYPLILRYRPARTVVEDIKLAVAGNGLLDGIFYAVFLRDIYFNKTGLASGLTHCLFAGATEFWFEFGNRYLGPFLRKQPSGSPGDTRARAGNKHYLVLQSSHDRVLLFQYSTCSSLCLAISGVE